MASRVSTTSLYRLTRSFLGQECADNSNSGFGRRRMYGVELGIIILATLCCALISSSPAMGSTGLLIFWRIIMVSLQKFYVSQHFLTISRALELVATTRSQVSLPPSKYPCCHVVTQALWLGFSSYQTPNAP
jgi:MFS family permease